MKSFNELSNQVLTKRAETMRPEIAEALGKLEARYHEVEVEEKELSEKVSILKKERDELKQAFLDSMKGPAEITEREKGLVPEETLKHLRKELTPEQLHRLDEIVDITIMGITETQKVSYEIEKKMRNIRVVITKGIPAPADLQKRLVESLLFSVARLAPQVVAKVKEELDALLEEVKRGKDRISVTFPIKASSEKLAFDIVEIIKNIFTKIVTIGRRVIGSIRNWVSAKQLVLNTISGPIDEWIALAGEGAVAGSFNQLKKAVQTDKGGRND